MKSGAPDLVEQLEQLKRAFDGVFALPEKAPASAKTRFVAISIGDRPFALRNADILTVLKSAPLTGVPSSVPSLLGLVQFRDGLLPVHDLGPLLGLAGTAGEWMVVDQRGETALAFSDLQGPIVVDEDPGPLSSGDAVSPRREIITGTGEVRPIVDLAAVLAALHQKCARAQVGRGGK